MSRVTTKVRRTNRRQVPPDLYGRRDKDRAWAALDRMISGYALFTQLTGLGRPEVTPVDRDLHLRIEEIRTEADEVISLHLTSPDGSVLPAWQPGCHLDLVLPSGKRRQYSLCSDPADRQAYRIAVRRIAAGGGGSVEVHDRLAVGDVVTVRGPRNAFPFIHTERYLFLAGGIGITPILPMVRAAARRGADWQLVYTGRSRTSMPFLDELTALDPDRVHIRTDDEHGAPTAAELLALAPEGAAVYCCGPTPMIDGVQRAFTGQAGTFHAERFSPPPVVGGAPFEVELARSGQVVEVAADQTALAAIRKELPDVGYSCQQGFCGGCKVSVLRGAVDHRDRVLTGEQKADSMLICVSRAEGRVVLDL